MHVSYPQHLVEVVILLSSGVHQESLDEEPGVCSQPQHLTNTRWAAESHQAAVNTPTLNKTTFQCCFCRTAPRWLSLHKHLMQAALCAPGFPFELMTKWKSLVDMTRKLNSGKAVLLQVKQTHPWTAFGLSFKNFPHQDQVLSSLVGEPVPHRHNHDAFTGSAAGRDFSAQPPFFCWRGSSSSRSCVCARTPAGVCFVLPARLRYAAPLHSVRILTSSLRLEYEVIPPRLFSSVRFVSLQTRTAKDRPGHPEKQWRWAE